MENNSAGLKITVSGVVLGRKATQEVRQGCLSQQLPAEIWTECFQIENNGRAEEGRKTDIVKRTTLGSHKSFDTVWYASAWSKWAQM